MKNIKYILCAMLVACSSATTMAMQQVSAISTQSSERTLDEVLSEIPEIEDIRQQLLRFDGSLKRELDRLAQYKFDCPGVAEQKLREVFLSKANPKAKKATPAEYKAYVAKLDFLAYMLKYQHDIMQGSLNMLYLLTMQGIVNATAREHLQLEDLIILSPEAHEEYEKHKLLFNQDNPADLTPHVIELLNKWQKSTNPDVALLAQIYCEYAVKYLVQEMADAFIGALQKMVDINSFVISNLQLPETHMIQSGAPISGLALLRQDPKTIIGCFHANKIRLMAVNGIIAKHNVAELNVTYPSLIQKLQGEILIYTHTHTLNEKLYAVVQQEISRSLQLGQLPPERESLVKKPLPKTLEPLHISRALEDLTALHDLLNKLLAPANNDNTEEECLQQPQQIDEAPQTTIVQPISKSALKKAKKRAKLQQQSQEATPVNAFVAMQEHTESQALQDGELQQLQQAQPAKKKKTRLEKLEERIALLSMQDQKEASPQMLSKAQRKQLNKERDLERFTQQAQSFATTQTEQPLVAPATQKLIKRAAKVQLSPTNTPPAPKKLVPVASDGSRLIKETATSIIIAGPRGTIITLQKKKTPGKDCAQRPGFYADDIKLWQQDPNAMILERYGIEYSAYDEELRRAVEIHAFAKTVDDYIETHSSTCKTNTRVDRPEGEIAICLPGKIRYANGQEEEGYFGYLVDANNKCFHRMFELKDTTSALAIQLRHNKCFVGYEKL